MDNIIVVRRENKKYVRYCAVTNCRSRSDRNTDLCYHSFPKAGERNVDVCNYFGGVEKMDKLEAWKNKTNVTFVGSCTKICSRHFKKEDYQLPDIPAERRILKKNAVPSRNLPCGLSDEKIVTDMQRLSRRKRRSLNVGNSTLKKKTLLNSPITESAHEGKSPVVESCEKMKQNLVVISYAIADVQGNYYGNYNVVEMCGPEVINQEVDDVKFTDSIVHNVKVQVKTNNVLSSPQPSTSAPLIAEPVLGLDEPTCSSRASSSTLSVSPSADPFIKLEQASSENEESDNDTTQELWSESSDQPIVNVGEPKCTSEDKKIIYCRLCLKPENEGSLTPLSEVDINFYKNSEKTLDEVQEVQIMLKFCLPFFNSLTANPIICSVCLSRLKSSYQFATECLKNQRLIEQYAEINIPTTEKAIDINEMIETNFIPSNVAGLSDTELEVPSRNIPGPSKNVTCKNIRQRKGEKYSHEGGPTAKKRKISTPQCDSPGSSNNVTPNIKIEPDDHSAVHSVDTETMIKVEPHHVDYPDMIKIELNNEVPVENDPLSTTTDTRSEVKNEYSDDEDTHYVPLGRIGFPTLVRKPVFSNVEFDKTTVGSNVVKIKLKSKENS